MLSSDSFQLDDVLKDSAFDEPSFLKDAVGVRGLEKSGKERGLTSLDLTAIINEELSDDGLDSLMDGHAGTRPSKPARGPEKSRDRDDFTFDELNETIDLSLLHSDKGSGVGDETGLEEAIGRIRRNRLAIAEATAQIRRFARSLEHALTAMKKQ